MIKLMILLAVSMCLAYCSQHGILVVPLTKKRKLDIPIIIIIIMLSLLIGLRTHYDDTQNYITMFMDSPTVSEYHDSSPGFFSNPLFYYLQSFFRHNVMDNHHLFFTVVAFFTISCIIWFIAKYSSNFPFSILLFFCIGMVLVPMSAMKQGLAIAVSLIGIDQLLKKRYIVYYLLLTIAILFHAYAIMLIVLPLFIGRPWTIFTYVIIGAVIIVLFTFESTITSFLSVAEDAGKSLNEEVLLDSQGINVFRLAVFAVPPILSFLFLELLNPSYNKNRHLFMNMSILSFLIMCMGIFSAANLFGRSAVYFEIGTILILPWVVEEMFNKESRGAAFVIVGSCYLLFFAYMVKDFSYAYRSIDIVEFVRSII